MEQLGAGSPPEGIEALAEPALKLIRPRGRSLAAGSTGGEGLDGTESGS